MASSTSSLLMVLYLLTMGMAIVIFSPTADATIEHHLRWMPTTPRPRPSCQGSIAECMALEEDEFQLDSDINRRILATSKYISYAALQRNTVPCSRRGASYYNCSKGAEANPYSRGCTTITRCRTS